MKYAIELDGISKSFAKGELDNLKDLVGLDSERFRAVSDINLRVKRGTVFGLLGPNGCGKSTVIRLISTLLIPESGTVKVMGVDAVAEPMRVRHMINRVSVDAPFHRKLSAYENLLYTARLYGLTKDEAEARMDAILDQIAFDRENLHTPVEKFSRGMQQKIAITRAFMTQPKALLLDEPTTGLDPVSKINVQEFIVDFMKKTDCTILITSHDTEEMDRLCDRIALMKGGVIIAEGTPNELKRMCGKTHSCVFEVDDTGKAAKIVGECDGVVEVEEKDISLVVHYNDEEYVLENCINRLLKEEIRLKHIETRKPDLEDVFISLTGKSLHEEEK